MPQSDVQSFVEAIVKEKIIRIFDSRLAQSVFEESSVCVGIHHGLD
jgi:hypothetical protein